MLPGLREHSCSRGRRGGFVERLQRGHLARPRHRARRARSSSRRSATTSGAARPARSRASTAATTSIYGYVDEQVGLAAGAARRTAGQPPRRGGPRVRLRRGAGGVHPPRRADRLRPVDPGDPRRGGVPRHPVDPAQPALARPARAGRPPEADPGHDDVARPARSPSTSPRDKDLTTRLLGAAGLPVPEQESVRTVDQAVTVAERIGYPVVRQAARRQPRPRGVPRPAGRRRRARRVPGRRGPVPPRLGDRRVVHHRHATTAA